MKKSIFTLFCCLVLFFEFNANAQSTLIHYWHFNNFTTAMYTPDIVGIDADYSIHDTSKAKILFAEIPGTSSSYSTYIDPNPAIPADYDTVNARMGQPDGNQMRPRNPVDSMRLLFYIPTVHYKNIVFKYATQSSSVAHGDTYQFFDYSVDSGLTWRTSGLSELYDSAWLVFKLVNISFSDPLVNNNSGLVFRIRFNGNTTLTSGNNRFDNVTVEGDSIIIPPAITTTSALYGPYCNATTSLITVPFTTTGTLTGSFSLQLSNPAGSFASGTTIIGSGASSPITASIPFGTASGTYRVRVINSSMVPEVDGTDNGSDIIVNGPPASYSVTGGGIACAGGMGVPIGVANSQPGASYQLYKAGVAIGGAVTGTGSPISFPNQTVAGTYTVKATYGGSAFCTSNMTGNAAVSVNPSPAVITGATTVCTGQTITLHDATSAGTWSTSSSATATIGTISGTVGGIVPGTTTITYTAAGCPATAVITVNPSAAITGTGAVCAGASITLSDAVTGGTWSAGNTNATVSLSSGVVTGAVSGSTSVITYTTPGGCLSTTIVTVNTSPSVIGGPTTVCASATINLTNIITGGTWVSANTTIATFGAAGALTGADTGTTGVTYTLPDGCAASAVVRVSLSPGPVISPSTVCSGATVPFTDVISGGLWSSGATSTATVGSLTGQVTGMGTGAATITYSLGGSSCTVFKTITVDPSPATITGITSICSGTNTLLVDGTSGGAWSSSNTFVATVSTTGGVTGAGTGTSAISYTLAGCAATAVVTVNTMPSTILGPSNVCAGSSILLSDGVTGGSWSSVNTNVVAATASISGLSAGPAVITYTIGSCSVTKTISVDPVAVMSGPTGVCVGSSAVLLPSVTGGTWASSATANATVSGSGSVTGVAPGPATIVYTLPSGCVTNTSVTVNTVPTAILGALHVCIGATTSLTDGAGGGTWTIPPGAAASVGLSSGIVTGASAGTAVVTYSLGTGCTVTAPITVNPLPLAISGTQQVCLGLTTSLADGTSGGTWNSANTTIATAGVSGVVWAVSTGYDTITYTISTGCKSIAVITVNPLPLPITVSGYVCLGLNTGLNDGSYGGTWSSSNTALATIDSNSGIVTGIGAGAPVITYTLPTTCMTTLAVTVNSIAPPITGTRHVCEGLTTSLGDPLPGGAWSTSDTTIATVNASGVVSGVSEGVITLSYITAICPATAMVTVNPIPGAIGGTGQVCVGSATALTDAGGGTWSSSNHFIASVDPGTGVVTGIYMGVVTITYTLDVGCSSTIPVIVDSLPEPITGASGVCLGATLHLGEATGSGVWSTINPGIATVNSTGTITGLSDGVATISYTIAAGCAATRSIAVSSVPAITGLSDMCAWGATQIAVDTASGGNWSSTVVSVSSTGLVTSSSPGSATVTYTLPTGCSSSAAFAVHPLPGPITGNPRLCVGLTTSLNDTTATGTWSSGNTAVATIGISGVVGGLSGGVSAITYTGATGCVEILTVTVSSLPAAILGATTICNMASTTLFDAVSGGTWSSSNTTVANAGITSGVITGSNAGVTIITYDLGVACTITDTITVNPLPTAYTVTGGGGYCAGGTGVDIGLAASYVGVNYQLYNGPTAVGSIVPGTYSNIDFGAQTAGGSYYVVATNTATSCNMDMSGGAIVTIDPPPAPHIVTGGGSSCAGGTGVHVGLATSDAGVNYQLYNAAATAGAALAGSGSALDFGLHAAAGTYGVIATSAVTGCTAHMPDSVTIAIAPFVTPSIALSSSLGEVLCAGTGTTFAASITNGGGAPLYQWKVNGISVTAATGPSYSYTPANGDVVKATMTSSAACPLPASVSDSIIMTVQPNVAPTVSLSAAPSTTITKGESVTLTATATNGGPAPVFQWKLNGTIVASVTTSTYTNSNFSNGDIVICTVTSSGTCAGQTGSTEVTITVSASAGIGQLSFVSGNISVVPNPSKGSFTIKGSLSSSAAPGAAEEIELEITDMVGRVVYKEEFEAANGELNKQVSLDHSIANGMYLLSLRSGTENKVLHIVVEQ